MYHTHTNILPYLTDWMSNPFDRVVCGDFSGKSHFSTSYCNSPLRSFCAIDPTSSENSRQAWCPNKEPRTVPCYKFTSRGRMIKQKRICRHGHQLEPFFFFGWAWIPTNWLMLARTQDNETRFAHSQRNATLWERGGCLLLLWHMHWFMLARHSVQWRPDSVSA